MTQRYEIDFDEVNDAATGNWGAIMAALAPDLEPAITANGKHVACPVHGGKNNDAFRIFKDFEQTGGVICNSCGAQPSGIATLKWLYDWDAKKAFTEVANYLGMTDGDGSKGPAVQLVKKHATPIDAAALEAKKKKAIERLSSAWNESVSPTTKEGRVLFAYLASRKLGIPEPTAALRVHPAYPYYHINDGKQENLGCHPTIMAKFSDKNGKPLTLHRTYLSKEGKKADIPYAVKKFMSSAPEDKLSGGAIYLDPPAPRIAICEGLETALAVRQATELNTVACCSATLLGKYEPNEVTQEVFIFADYDDGHAGQNAAMTLSERLFKMGVQAHVFFPPRSFNGEETKGVDWLDAYAEIGRQAFPYMALPGEKLEGTIYFDKNGNPSQYR